MCFTSFLHETAGIYHVVLVSNAQREQKTLLFLPHDLHNPLRETSLKRTDLRKGLICANCTWMNLRISFHDRGDGPQKLRVGEWVSGNLLREKTPNSLEFYIFVAGGMNLQTLGTSLLFFCKMNLKEPYILMLLMLFQGAC